MKNLLYRALLAFLVFLPAAASAEQAIQVQSAQDVISRWDPQQHLFTKGNVGVSVEQMSALESWLDENGPNWVIVLMKNAVNETYRAADGRDYRGMDAVEHALGHGLSNRTGFGELTDPRTGESNGAAFVVFLQERKFSYFGSDAQDRRRLGEAHWQGELDQPAFRAMRGGQRIRDAVKDTVTSINRRLQQTIEGEIKAAQAEQQERKEVYQQLLIRIAALSEDISLVESQAIEFKAIHLEAVGELTEPPVNEWRSELGKLQEKLTEETMYAVSQEVTSLHDRVAEYLNGYALGESFDEQAAALDERLQKIGVVLNGVAKPTAEEARALIDQARSERDAGRFEFIQQLKDADTLADRGDQEILAEQARLEREARLRKVVRATAAGASLLTVGGLGFLGLVLNRRRRTTMQQAQEFFAKRRESVAQEVDKVFKLFERSGEVLGSKDRIKDRGYQGKTRELSERTFENVDDLIVMSSEVERVMDEAELLIHPQNPISKAVNVFSGSRYSRGVDRISGKPLIFKRDKGLPLALEEALAAQGTAADESNDGQPPESIQLTFEEVFAHFHDRSERASVTLDRIEASLLQVNDGLTALQADIDRATKVEQEIRKLAKEDKYFEVPSFFDKLLPSAQMDFDAADVISGSDPVTAVDAHLPDGTRKIQDGLQLAASIKRGHQELLPHLREMAPLLEAEGYEAGWIDERLSEMTAHADELFAKAAAHSVANEALAFNREVDGLGHRATRCLEIAKQLKTELEPSVPELERTIEQARKNIGDKLGLLSHQVLHEKPRDPDDDLAAGRRQIDVIVASLHTGNMESANEAVTQLKREIQEGNLVVADTLTAMEQFDSQFRTRQEETAAARKQQPTYESLVEATRNEYADNTYRLQAVDTTYPDEESTIDSHRDACRAHLAEAERLLKLSREFFDKGRILEATAMLDAIHDDVQLTNQMYHDLDNHVRELQELTRANAAELAKLVSQIDHMHDDVSERRTMRPTMEFFQNKVQEVQLLAHEVEERTAARDPIGVATRIERLAAELEEVAARVTADRNAHAEANRSVESAAAQIATGRRLIQRARQDGIPDSHTTSLLVRDIESSDGTLNEVRRRLSIPHDDWKAVNDAAIKLHSELGEASGKLQGELQRAQQAAESLASASQTVFEAGRWTDGLGVQDLGSPGSRELERARGALHGAKYDATIELSRAASMMAGHAIQKAQREVARRQRDQLRRAEQQRRQRSSSSGSFGGFGGGGSISGGRSSGGGSSGFSRSGW